MLNTCTDN